MEPVTLQTNLLDLVEQYPELKKVFGKHGISWLDVTCLDKTDNMIEDAATTCGIIPDELLDELNRALEDLQAEESRQGHGEAHDEIQK